MTGSLWAFLLISIFVLVTPGPDTAVTIRNTLLGGRIAGVATAFGIALGQWIWALATSVGLVAILLASEPVFNAIRWAGAVYLVWLGVQTLRSAMAPKPGGAGPAASHASGGWPVLSASAAFRQGLLSDLGNPKMAVFFASVLPQFAPEGQGMLSALALLGIMFSAMTLAWLTLYATVIASLGDAFRRSRTKRAIEGLMGAALVGFGVRIAYEQR
ncbi:MAG: LysE family translocator [Rhodospirillales bacterium]|nr:LysE family translocator [Rhodospirillales bacterium]